MNPFARPLHSWNCDLYHPAKGEACTCWAIVCYRCRDPQRPGKKACFCLAAEIEEEGRWADWEAFREDERLAMQDVPVIDQDHAADIHYNYWVNREYERNQQASEKSGGWK